MHFCCSWPSDSWSSLCSFVGIVVCWTLVCVCGFDVYWYVIVGVCWIMDLSSGLVSRGTGNCVCNEDSVPSSVRPGTGRSRQFSTRSVPSSLQPLPSRLPITSAVTLPVGLRGHTRHTRYPGQPSQLDHPSHPGQCSRPGSRPPRSPPVAPVTTLSCYADS